MEILDFFPLKAFFQPDELVQLELQVSAGEKRTAVAELVFSHLDHTVGSLSVMLQLEPGAGKYILAWQPPSEAARGYGVAVHLIDQVTAVEAVAFTAFDVLHSWTDFPRYGFLTDFTPHRTDIATTLDRLLPYHINALQFYDWQYRHDCLVPPQEIYLDPLGRQLSLRVVLWFIRESHARGMATMPYLAIYAASLTFWKDHPDWALYDSEGKPHSFEGFLGLMDPSPGSKWSAHLQNECARALTSLPFDGLHVDQYGEPRHAFNVHGQPVNLPHAFHSFINALTSTHPGKAVTFNAVKNWPIETLVHSPLDFLYIELWPSTPTYRELAQIVVEGQDKSGGKPVVVALYLAAERSPNIRLADALILASGGTRIELGENERLLADPYFPKHQPIPSELRLAMRRYYDFAVRYGEWLGPRATHLPNDSWEIPTGMVAVARQSNPWKLLNLVNFSGLGDAYWTEAHPDPSPRVEVAVSSALPQRVQEVYWASPDHGEPHLQPAKWQVRSGRIHIKVPYVDFWTLIAIRTEAER